MANSFLQRLFAKKKRNSDAKSLSLSEGAKSLVQPGTSSSDVTKQQNRKPLESPNVHQNAETKKKVNALFAFVDRKDPFTPSEIADEELPGPILSTLSAKQFDSVFLLYTPQTRENAVATKDEIERRHKGCRVKWQPLPVSDPKDYSSLMGSLWRYGGDLVRRSDADENYVCVSSGTAEMRAAWFLLTTLGIVKAKLLQVGTPAQPLFGKVYVKELRLDTVDWQTIWHRALRAESFDTVTLGPKLKDTVLRKEPKAGAEAFGFDTVFVERMRKLYGNLLTNLLLPLLRAKFLSNNLPTRQVQPLTDETFRRFAKFLSEVGFRYPRTFGAFVNAVSNDVLLEYYRSSRTRPGIQEADLVAPSALNELKLTPGQSEELLRGLYRRDLTPYQIVRQLTSVGDQTAEKVRQLAGEGAEASAGESETAGEETQASAEEPETAGEWRTSGEEPETAGGGTEERVSSDKKRPETRGSENEAPREPAREEGPEEAEILDDIEPESREAQDGATEVTSAKTEEDLLGIVVAEGRLVPGLDDALQELGIHVGSAILRIAAERAGIAADSQYPVLLLGETGTGKERFAHLIHRLSPRFGKDMVIVNCAAIPAPLAESYLFGHVKGAFSDATNNKEGIFENADQTTLFLDEIAELTLEVQAKLLRVIEEGKVQRLGNHKPRKVDVRLIAATNRDLTKEVSAGRFREDLYYRIERIQIKLPPLRERRSEIPELALALLRQINLRRRKPRQLSSGALIRLERYHWPGNVRQLSNVLERSVLYARGDAIQPDDLLINEDAPAKDPFATLPEPFPGFNIEEFLTLARKHLFLKALTVCKGNQTEAAALLGVSKQAVSKFVAGQNDNEN